MLREFHVLSFPSQNKTQSNIKGKGKNTPLKICTSFSVRFQLIPIGIKWEKAVFRLDLTRKL